MILLCILLHCAVGCYRGCVDGEFSLCFAKQKDYQRIELMTYHFVYKLVHVFCSFLVLKKRSRKFVWYDCILVLNFKLSRCFESVACVVCRVVIEAVVCGNLKKYKYWNVFFNTRTQRTFLWILNIGYRNMFIGYFQ